MTNFLQETIKAIKESDHSPEDIIFIGSQESGYQCNWKQFIKLADFEYDDGYGAQKIAEDLIVVFSDAEQLQRSENDGKEWWDFIPPFKFYASRKEIKRLQVNDFQTGWETLESIHESKDYLEC